MFGDVGLGLSHYPTVKCALGAEMTRIFYKYSPLSHDSYTVGGLDFLGLVFPPHSTNPLLFPQIT